MSDLKIGWAVRDISIDKPVNIRGQYHMRISRGILDPVMITALTVNSGEDYVIFVSMDAVAMSDGFLDLLREKVKKENPKIDTMKILASVTHTHCGASHYKADASKVAHDGVEIASSDEYREFAVLKGAEAVCEAFEQRKEGGIAYGYGYAVVAHSRRVVYFDDISQRPGEKTRASGHVNGHAKMYGETNDDNFSHYEAGADHFSNFMFTFDKAGKLTGAIVNIPCPSQNSEQEFYLSADYWNDVRVAIKEKYGDIFILPQCAAAGDLSPRVLHYKNAQKRRYALKYADYKVDERVDRVEEMYTRRDIAERIAESFDEVYAWAKKDIITDAPIKHVVETVYLSRRIITDEELEFNRKEYDDLMREDFVKTDDTQADLKHNSTLVTCRNRCENIMDKYEAQKTEPKLPMELHVIKIGQIAFVSNRFELYMDYQHRIQARSPFTQTFVVQLAGQPGAGAGSYLPTERGLWGRGYSATMYCNVVSPRGGQELVDETVRILKGIY